MYCEWASLQQEIETDAGHFSVLHKFPSNVGHDVASSVVRNMAQHLSASAQTGLPCNLNTDSEVKWTMQVICYGLSLPLSEVETIKDCVSVYCDWLSALTSPRPSVPLPIIGDPNPYCQEILQHLYNLYEPRTVLTPDAVGKQAVHCHRVLRIVQHVAVNSTYLSSQTWDCLLKFLLAINDMLLAPPTTKDSLGDSLCERVLSVLFEVWILACAKSFPSPPLWKTFRDMCARWRHHEALVVQWHRVNVAFLSQLLKFMYGPSYPQLNIAEEDAHLIPDGMSHDCVAQCWFRFLHMLSDPVDLSRPAVISSTPKFLHHALTSQVVMDPEQHECLANLPHIFHRAMMGVAILVNAFLGLDVRQLDQGDTSRLRASHSHTFGVPGSTPPATRRPKSQGAPIKGKEGSKASMMSPRQTGAAVPPTFSSLTTGTGHLSAKRPRVNSVLHLFGAWLVEAAVVGVKVHGTAQKALSRSRTASFHVERDPMRPHSLSGPSPDGASQGNLYEAGRAEACATLCRLFCSRKTGEAILPVYLARFYIVMHYGLQANQHLSGQVLSQIILHASNLLRIDLDGVMVLLPQVIRALELVLLDLTPNFKHDEVLPVVELRKASIHLLQSILCLPLHFTSLIIRNIFAEMTGDGLVTFFSLKMRIIELLQRALTVENDSTNTQMLLGGLMLCVQDLALHEEAELIVQQEDSDEPGPPSPIPVDSSELLPKIKNNVEQNYPETSLQKSNQDRDFDSAHGLFGHAASLVCHRLMVSWKMDLNIALAAIEVLSGLAKIKLIRPNMLMCKRTVNWICEFIVYQCSRPAPSHSKDLHSMIVAAFHCLALWLVQHTYLMQDKECLQGVLEVVELGISGSRSQVEQHVHDDAPKPPLRQKDRGVATITTRDELQHKASDIPKLKGDKELKPVSMRVKEAAEGLLTVIMDHVGSFPPPCGPESVCSLLDEESLLKHCKDGGLPEHDTPFRYFVLEGTTIVGLYDQPLGNDQDPLPTVTSIIRGPFGCHAWTMQLRHQPRLRKSGSKATLSEPMRPQPENFHGVKHNIKHRYFPEVVDKVDLVLADKSIPALETTMKDEAHELEKLAGFIQQQITFEAAANDRHQKLLNETPFPNPATECKPPTICHDFQTARLFLSHYGFLSLEALKEPTASSVPPSLVMLEPVDAPLLTDLQQLDSIPVRTADTVHIFYVKTGQNTAAHILGNVVSQQRVSAAFLELLRSLGWPVDVKKHAGWTGHVATSWKIQPTEEQDEVYPGDTGGSLYDGQQQVLYWADVSSEVAFVVPSPHTFLQRRASLNSQEKAPVGAAGDMKPADLGSMKHKSMSLDLDRPPPDRLVGSSLRPNPLTPTDSAQSSMRRYGRAGSVASVPDTKIFVVWLESYEDHEHFPIADLMAVTHTGSEYGGRHMEPPLYIIFIHALDNGLYRIHMQGPPTHKISMAIPLVDGMVASRRSLGPLLRQTAINICRRKRLENDTYQPPHVRRKLKIKEIVEKYRSHLSEPDFFTALFTTNSTQI